MVIFWKISYLPFHLHVLGLTSEVDFCSASLGSPIEIERCGGGRQSEERRRCPAQEVGIDWKSASNCIPRSGMGLNLSHLS